MQDINELLRLAGLEPNKTKLDENCAGSFAGTFEDDNKEKECDRKENRERITKNHQDIDYDEAMTSESDCKSPYDDGHGQYGEKCLVGDDVVVDKSPENGKEITLELGEDDDIEIVDKEDSSDDREVHLDYEMDGVEPDQEASTHMAAINNVGDRYQDHTVDADVMIQKIDVMQQGGMSSSSAHFDIDRLHELPAERIANIYRKVMGEDIEEDYAEDMKAAVPSNMQHMVNRDDDAIVISGDEDEDYKTSGELTGEGVIGSAVGGALGKAAGTSLGGPVGGAIGSAVGSAAGGAITGEDIEDDMAMTSDEDEWEEDSRRMIDVDDLEGEINGDFGYDDPTDEIPTARTRGAVQDTESMIRSIMAAKENGAFTPHSEETLNMLSPDALQRILIKVGGEKVEEEDCDWRSEPGYQTKPSDAEGNLRTTSPYNGGEGFPTGQASNAATNIGNTGADFKDNPLRNKSTVTMESDSLESINQLLTEGFSEFCESYAEAVENEIAESDLDFWKEKEHGKMPPFLKKQAGSLDGDYSDRDSTSDIGDDADLPAFLQKQAESLGEEEPDPTLQRYMDALNPADAGLDDPEIDHNCHDDDIEDIPRGDVSIDDLDAEGYLGDHMASLGANADMSDILQVMRDLESKKNKGYVESTEELEEEDPCWDGYEQVGMKDKGGKEVPNCVPEGVEEYTIEEAEEIFGYLGEGVMEAEYQGREVDLNKPTQGDVKKFKVFVKDPKTGNVKKVNFGDPDMKIKKSNPEARKSFRARHKCDQKKDKTTAGYWSCKKW